MDSCIPFHCNRMQNVMLVIGYVININIDALLNYLSSVRKDKPKININNFEQRASASIII